MSADASLPRIDPANPLMSDGQIDSFPRTPLPLRTTIATGVSGAETIARHHHCATRQESPHDEAKRTHPQSPASWAFLTELRSDGSLLMRVRDEAIACSTIIRRLANLNRNKSVASTGDPSGGHSVRSFCAHRRNRVREQAPSPFSIPLTRPPPAATPFVPPRPASPADNPICGECV